jgi:hypothetical protein
MSRVLVGHTDDKSDGYQKVPLLVTVWHAAARSCFFDSDAMARCYERQPSWNVSCSLKGDSSILGDEEQLESFNRLFVLNKAGQWGRGVKDDHERKQARMVDAPLCGGADGWQLMDGRTGMSVATYTNPSQRLPGCRIRFFSIVFPLDRRGYESVFY